MSMLTYDFAAAFGMSTAQRIAQQGNMAAQLAHGSGYSNPFARGIPPVKPHVHLRDRKAPPWPTDLNERWWE